MPTLLVVLMLAAGQPVAGDEEPVSAGPRAPPPVPQAAPPAPPQKIRGYTAFRGAIVRKPMTEEEAREAANRAAIARAEQAGRDANTPGDWLDDSSKMRCRQTAGGFACGNSDKAIDDQEAAMKARLESMNKAD